ncbi:MAG: addiction module protein [Candidatus Aminicenantes bacterium]|nr:addiction module protein [Candidatus Aminicenantes bacterium]
MVTLKRLKNEALELPIQERAELAHILIASIEERGEMDVSSAWDMELEKRIREIREDKVKGVPVEEVFAKLEKKYH